MAQDQYQDHAETSIGLFDESANHVVMTPPFLQFGRHLRVGESALFGQISDPLVQDFEQEHRSVDQDVEQSLNAYSYQSG